MLIALIEVFAAIFVWLELIVRDAVIYLAVLFFPVALAAAIWPALAAWPGRLGRLLLLFVILKPVALIVLSFAGNAAAAGLSFSGGVSGSVGTILAATVIFALAAFAPWALMYLLAADAESAYAGARRARGRRRRPSPAQGGASVRTGGGLRNLAGTTGRGGAAAADPRGWRRRSRRRRPGGGPPNAERRSSTPQARAGGGGRGGQNGRERCAVGAATIGGGSVGAAAGVASALASRRRHEVTVAGGDQSQRHRTGHGRPSRRTPAGEPAPGARLAVSDGRRQAASPARREQLPAEPAVTLSPGPASPAHATPSEAADTAWRPRARPARGAPPARSRLATRAARRPRRPARRRGLVRARPVGDGRGEG